MRGHGGLPLRAEVQADAQLRAASMPASLLSRRLCAVRGGAGASLPRAPAAARPHPRLPPAGVWPQAGLRHAPVHRALPRRPLCALPAPRHACLLLPHHLHHGGVRPREVAAPAQVRHALSGAARLPPREAAGACLRDVVAGHAGAHAACVPSRAAAPLPLPALPALHAAVRLVAAWL